MPPSYQDSDIGSRFVIASAVIMAIPVMASANNHDLFDAAVPAHEKLLS
jgi:hypothetical protein